MLLSALLVEVGAGTVALVPFVAVVIVLGVNGAGSPGGCHHFGGGGGGGCHRPHCVRACVHSLAVFAGGGLVVMYETMKV